MYPKLFNIINTYPLFIIIGIILAYQIIKSYVNKNNINKIFHNYFINSAFISLIIGFIFAMIFQSIYIYIENPTNGFSLTTNMTFYGGLIGGSATFILIYFLYGRKKYGSYMELYLPIIIPAITLAHCFGRLGCFFAGCCYGIETNSIFGIKFPFLDHKVYPTQLFESLFLLILFFITYQLAKKKRFNYNIPIYLCGYGIFRFLIEYLRGDERGQLIGAISPSQFWSILLIATGLASIWIIKYRKNISNKISQIIDYFLNKEMFRFLIAGGINTLMGGILIPYLVSKFIHIQFIIDIPLVIGYLFWFTFAYFIQIKFVFNSTFEWKRFWAYPLSQIPNLTLNLLFKYIFSLFINNNLITYILSALLPIPIMFFIVRFIVKNTDSEVK